LYFVKYFCAFLTRVGRIQTAHENLKLPLECAVLTLRTLLMIFIEINDIYSECHKYILWAELKVSVVEVGRRVPFYSEELRIYGTRNLTSIGPCIVIYFYTKTNQMHQCIKFILFWNYTLRVSDRLSVHHQQFKTVHTATVKQIQLSVSV